jgi:ABC-type nitrate/sulfonate/bicarbonate transport systems, periplasmic components
LPGGRESWLNLALERGYFKDEGLNVKITTGEGGVDALRNLQQGLFDLTIDPDASAGLTLLGEGADIQAIMLLNAYAPYGFQSFASKGIKTPKDFEGHSVGLEPGSIGEQIFAALAKINGFDLAKVKKTSVSPDLYTTAFLQGQIDIVSGFIDAIYPVVLFQAKQENIELSSIWAKDWGIDTYGGMIWAKKSTLQDHPDAIQGFLRAAKRGMEAGAAEPAAAVQATTKAFEALNPEIVALQWDAWLSWAKDATITAKGYGCADMVKMQSTVDTFESAMSMTKPILAADFFTNKFMDWCSS